MKILKRLCAFCVLCGAPFILRAEQQPAPPQPDPQVPPVTFKVEVNYVEVDAVVVDENGNFVRDLKKENFQVFEDGKPQTISTFAPINLPIERADRPLFAARPIEPDVSSNARDFDGRLYVIVLDDIHTRVERSPRVRAAARQFIERHFGANDLAAVVHTSGRGDASQEFTSNPRLLVAAVDKFMGRRLRSQTAERIDEYYRTRDQRQPGDRINDPLEFERGYNARSMLDTLRNVSDFLAGIRGRRKALVFISEGIDYDITDVINNREASTIIDETRDAIAAATRANVNIYAIDPRGLTAMGDELIEIASLPDDTSLGLGSQSLQTELRNAQDSLRTLADETGGFAAVNSNDFAGTFERLVSDNSSYYVLGYYPANDRRDGRFRKIEVRVTGRPGLRVRARKGYVAPRGRPDTKTTNIDPSASAELREALNSPLPTRGLRLTAFAAPFRGAAPNDSIVVAVEANGADLKVAEGSTLEFSIAALDKDGKVRTGTRNTANLGSVKPETRERVTQGGFRMLSRIELPPGRYQLRIGAAESGGRIGSVFHDLDVPDFTKSPLMMSGLIVASSASARMPTARADQVKEITPVVPTAVREFAAGDEVGAFVEVYDNQLSKPHTVEIVATVLTDDGREVFRSEEQRQTSEIGGGARGGFGYMARIPLKDFQPGLYVLRVQATARIGDRAGVGREVQFRVR